MASEQSAPVAVLAQRQQALVANFSGIQHHCMGLKRAKYRVVRRVSKALKWDIVEKDDKDATIVWLDRWEHADLTNLRYYKTGHFPGMSDLGTKCILGRTLNRMRQEFPLDYDFHPVSFSLPRDRERLAEFDSSYRQALKARGGKNNAAARPISPTKSRANGAAPSADDEYNPGGHPLLARPDGCWPAPGHQPQPLASAGDRMVYIVKPDGGSRGQGIYLALGLDQIDEYAAAVAEAQAIAVGQRPKSAATDDDDDDDEEKPQNKAVMVQAYLPRPLLIDNRKFDLRIYVLVTSVYPTLRLFIYSQGLVRFATVPYRQPDESNIAQRRMFLTNYAVNKPGERPRSPKTGIDDVMPSSVDGTGSSAAAAPAPARTGKAARYDRVVAGGSDKDRDDNSDGSDDDGDDGGGARWGPPRDKGVDLVRQRVGCKWTLSSLWECLEAQGVDTDATWARIKDVITKTILAVRPSMAAKYRAARPQLRKEPMPAWAEVKAAPKKRLPARPPSFLNRMPAPQPAVETAPLPEPEPPAPVSDIAATVKAVLTGHNAGAGAGLGGTPALRTGQDLVDPMAGLLATGSSIPVGSGLAGVRAGGRGKSSSDAPSRRQAAQPVTLANGTMDFGLGLTIGAAPILQSQPKPLPINKAAMLREKTQSFNGLGSLGLGVAGNGLGIAGSGISAAGQTGETKYGSYTSLTAGASTVSAGMAVTGLVPRPAAGLAMSAQSSAATGVAAAGIAAAGRPALAGGLAGIAAAAVMKGLPAGPGSGAATPVGTGPGSDASSVVTASSVSTGASLASSVGGAGGAVIAPGMRPGSLSADSTPLSTPARKTGPGSTTGGTTKPPMSGTPKVNTPKDDEAALIALQEEDGEQGFRGYEFMGLDIILDMSHCACEKTAVHQRLSSDPSTWAETKASFGPHNPRCQPRPVLLEINQSCSMHTDTDLDIVVKGDAVHDAFGMAAADEKWLLEGFIHAIKSAGGLAAVASGAGAAHGLEAATAGAASGAKAEGTSPIPPGPLLETLTAAEAALSDPSKDPTQTKVTATGTTVDMRACLNDLTRIHAEAVGRKREGLELASALLGEAWTRPLPQPPAKDAGKAVVKSGGSNSSGGNSGPSDEGYDPSSYGSSSGQGGGSSPGDGSKDKPVDENEPPTGSTTRPSSARAPVGTPNAGAINLKSEMIPWVPPPSGPLPQPLLAGKEGAQASGDSGGSGTATPTPTAPPFLGLYSLPSLAKFWSEEFWFGTRHHEPVLMSAAARAARWAAAQQAAAQAQAGQDAPAPAASAAASTPPTSSGTGSSGPAPAMASVVEAVMMRMRQANSAPSSSGGLTSPTAGGSGSGSGDAKGDAKDKDSKGSVLAKSGHTYTLATIPPLSARAQLVLLLRHIHETIHQGGFERMVPPTDPRLADRYRKIAEYVPPALRETPAYARRRLEALAVRAAIEAKKGGSFRL